MTFHDVFEKLAVIDQAAVSLLKETSFHSREGLGGSVRPLQEPAEDIFLRDLTENMLESLELLHEEFNYIKSPVCGEYQLELFPNGRYGFFDKNGKIHVLSCGKTIEVKIMDRYGRLRWARSRIEHDGSDYYLWGHLSIPLTGLTVREREVAQ